MSIEFSFPDWAGADAGFDTGFDAGTFNPGTVDTGVDPHQVEGLVNRFIAGKQNALFDAPDAYYRQTGADAVDGVPGILDRLNTLREDTLDATGNDATLRDALEPRLDSHIAEATDGITRHAAAQREARDRQIISERQSLLQRAASLEHDNDDKLSGLAEANAGAAIELARKTGQPEQPAADSARSAIWHTAIAQRIANGDGPGALDLFQRSRGHLTDDHVLSLDTPLQVARDDQAAAFERDPFAAGTALYKEVGAPVPIEDTAGRIRQARMIAQHRGIAVAPFTSDEVAQQRDVVLAAYPELPDDMKAAIVSLIKSEHPLTVRDTASDTPITVPATRQSGVELAQVDGAVSGDRADDGKRMTDLQSLGVSEKPAIGMNTEPTSDTPEHQHAAAQAASLGVQGRRGTFADLPPPNDPDLEKAFQNWRGVDVVLPNGQTIPDSESPTGHVMGPFSDLKSVATAGRQARWTIASRPFHPIDAAKEVMRANLAQGGAFDYQRRPYSPGKDGYTQLTQFRNVANVNVGLFCQKLGLPLWLTLKLAGEYAREHSSNYKPKEPYGLDPPTMKYIVLGYEAGEGGGFD